MIRIFGKIFLLLLLSGNVLAAPEYGLGRGRSCSGDGSVEGMDFDPTTGGKDAQFVLTNPLCISVIASTYAGVKGAIAYMNSVCGTGSALPRVMPSPILDSIDIARASKRAFSNGACAKAMLKASAVFGVAIGQLGAIYEIADSVFDNAEVCGANWKKPNPKQYLINTPNHKGVVENRINEFMGDELQRHKLNFGNVDYREWYYGGVEVNSGVAGHYCPDVTLPMIGGKYPAQKYYLKGWEIGNYNCEKYDVHENEVDPADATNTVDSRRAREFKEAYDCCRRVSQNYICLDYRGEKHFCKAGERCEIQGIYFESRLKNNGSMICAQTYSLCPYNFYVGGGAEFCDYFQDGKYNSSSGKYDYIDVADVESGNCAGKSEVRNDDCTYNDKAGKCKNYCQYMRHCTKVNDYYRYRSTLTSPYFSRACLNFVGDSQNRVSYNSGFIAGSARHFSAPIAQCFKETLENVFYNRAGHTKCALEGDNIDSTGNCVSASGNLYKEGETVARQSFFERLQGYLKGFVMMAMVLSITFYGGKIMIGAAQVNKKEVLMYILKIGLVFFFALGFAWQKFFFDGVYSASTVLSQVVFKIQMPDEENRRDGCQFGVVTDSSGAPVLSPVRYPRGKEYLAIWDSLDCKIARYMGFGPEVSTANIAKLILAGFITGPAGLYFALALFVFAFMFISATIRALHIFLASSFAILVMVYISPIIFVGTLFKKTEGMFKGWLQQIISYIFQPVLLFAYIAIFLSIVDKTLIGSATFYGPGPNKAISCSKYCVDAFGKRVSKEESPQCDRLGEKIVKPGSDSFACLIGIDNYSEWPGLEIIGISLPFILELFTEDAQKKILTILKGALIMFFLDKFMSEIPNIAKQLIGGSGLPQSGPGTRDLFGRALAIVKPLRKRAMRASVKASGAATRGAEKAARHAAEAGDKGKSVASGNDAGTGGEDSAGDGGGNGGGGDQGGGEGGNGGGGDQGGDGGNRA